MQNYSILTKKILSFLWLPIILQCIITLVTLPILIHAGLPLTPLGLLGNILYSPFLIAFMGLSAMIFVCLLLSINISPLVWLLSLVSNAWFALLKLGEPFGAQWYFADDGYKALALCWLTSGALLFLKIFQKSRVRWMFSSILLCIMSIFTLNYITKSRNFAWHKDGSHFICGNFYNQKLIVHDFYTRIPSKHKNFFINVLLIPWCAKNFGTIKIEEYHLYANGKSKTNFIEILQKELSIKKVILHSLHQPTQNKNMTEKRMR